jgi:hypothetical protein
MRPAQPIEVEQDTLRVLELKILIRSVRHRLGGGGVLLDDTAHVVVDVMF